MTTPAETLSRLVGTWSGRARTWFEPDELADDQPIEGVIARRSDYGENVYRHEYDSVLNGIPLCGETTLVYNNMARRIESSWIDSFHMSYGVMFSHGQPTDAGFSLLGEYELGPDHPPWGWRTDYRFVDDDHLVITAYNISPFDRAEDRAVEFTYERTE